MAANRKKTLGYVLYWLGIIIALALTALVTWASIEAMVYGFTTYSKVSLEGVSCPPLMTRSEKAVITASIKNPSDKPVSFLIRADISSPELLRSERENVTLEPGETRTFQWAISSSDIDLKRFIFARVYRYSSYLWKLAEATCGVYILDVPYLTGRQIYWGGVISSIVLIALGLRFTREPARPIQQGRSASLGTAMKFLAVVAVLGLAAGMMRSWLLGILVLVVSVILIMTVLLSKISKQ